MKLDEKIEKYLTEEVFINQPSNNEIRYTAQELTDEIVTSIQNILTDHETYENLVGWNEDSLTKMLNIALKGVKINKFKGFFRDYR